MNNYKVILFYKFIRIPDTNLLRDEQRKLCESLGFTGRMLIAEEGINATFEGTSDNIAIYEKTLRENPLFSDTIFKKSSSTGHAFHKLEIRVRNEIVTLKSGVFDIQNETAPQITAEELHNLYATKDDFVVLDLRNNYEISVGYFEKTIHPNLRNFRELPEKLSSIEYLKSKKVIAVCTGGIRCEKATCLLKRQGFQDVYQLKDGIHSYMEKYPSKHFKGTLFVFDNRMVTSVVETSERVVVGECLYCKTKCENFYNNDTVKPSVKVICCDICVLEHKELRAYVSA